MEKLDRQVWAVSARLAAYGLRIGIRANREQALMAVLASLPPGLNQSEGSQVDLLYSVVAGDAEPANGLQRYSLAYANSTQLARAKEFGTIPAAVEHHLSLHVAEFAKTRVFIHAGVVGWKGKAVLIPGRSFAGKSTLVTALLRHGAVYYSDEFAVIDPVGRVHPCPRPIQLRTGHGTTNRIHPTDLPAHVGKKSLPAGLVLVTQYQSGAAWQPERVSLGEGMLALLTNTVSAQRDPGRALSTLSAMVTGATILKGPRGEADETVARLLCDGDLSG
jgi:hypothetical protein